MRIHRYHERETKHVGENMPASFTPYCGDRYWDYDEIIQWCTQITLLCPEWISLKTLGHTQNNHPIILLIFGKNPETTPTLWVDAGTHASEWTGVMASIFSMSSWYEELQTKRGKEWFTNNSIAILPCISPDGYQHLRSGGHFVRSSLREAPKGVERIGLDPQDLTGDGCVRWMRWKHPAGPYCGDETTPMGIRKRNLQDDPADAFFLCSEGTFLEWDGTSWKQAPLRNGLDLNRNFPVQWSPFSMFGMDGGVYPLCEIESRLATEALLSLPRTCAVLSNHTYTGALLTQPYHPDPVLGDGDIRMMYELAEQSVQGTDYRVIQVHPDFSYDPKKRIIGVWADFVSSNFGIPAYTLELWNPFSWAGIDMNDPASFFGHPDPEIITALMTKACQEDFSTWKTIEHPQLGTVEVGGFSYLTTIRNPPEHLLIQECQKGLQVANNMRRSLPSVHASYHIELVKEGLYSLSVILENHGFLSSIGTKRAWDLKIASRPTITITPKPLSKSPIQRLNILEGWGTNLYTQNPIYPNLGSSSPREKCSWIVPAGTYQIQWDAGRGGSGILDILVG
ncbi:MAG: hypothetical protein CL916_06505 [Deltaproteobacteria bacterium]|nr:hypothetical protein [Deltaproteobacteria bacterium]